MASYRASLGEMSTSNHKSGNKKKKGKIIHSHHAGSDSDQSAETNSLSADSQDTRRSPNDTHKPTSKKGEWEILEGLKEGQRFELVPRKFEGYLLKRRKWPLKGWHKRFFVLDQSLLVYSKSAADLARGKKHASMDIGMSVISTKARRRRIDIDADSNIFHLKCKSMEMYMQWVEQLKQHRLHKQHQLLYPKSGSKLTDVVSSPDDSPTAAEVELENECFTGRRIRLPVPKPPSKDFSPFKFIYKKFQIPISINEPLNMLQRLCEELEYSELLDKAATLDDPAERMVQVAAFAVSSYASSIYRAAHKPFNPLLGETYECIREDKGFRFIAEQVNHHPPVSACHAQSSHYTFWQDVRIKTTFWGRSLEFQPSGTVSLVLPQYDDHYEWNKITTCVHNLFGGGQRWVDQYGEMAITNKSKDLTCKLSFVKANSWSAKRHEVFGTIFNEEGKVLHNLFGKWTEALYCGHAPSARVVWRPGSMPEDYHLYYGFTRFAIELNELYPEQSKFLPPTDTRFRPDQRLLEEGNLSASESMKQQLEQQQRERRRKREEEGVAYIPMWFRSNQTVDGDEAWVFGEEYWNKRKDPGFANMSFEQIW